MLAVGAAKVFDEQLHTLNLSASGGSVYSVVSYCSGKCDIVGLAQVCREVLAVRASEAPFSTSCWRAAPVLLAALGC